MPSDKTYQPPKEGSPLRTRSPHKIVAMLFALTLVAAGCGDSDEDTADTGTETTEAPAGGTGTTEASEEAADLSDLSGDVFITGSSTVEPISIRVAEDFADVAPDVVVDVEGPGTGDGFLKFCNGEAAISDASRAIKDEEAQTCSDNGIEFTELQVAIDGIAVVTSADNQAVDCLNFADLYALFGPESEGFDSWADAQSLAAELGSDTEFPDAPLEITAPGTESGTYDSFIEIALAGFAEEQGAEETTRTDYTSSADDNVIVTNISASDTGLGWVGYAFFEENQDALRAIPIAEEPGGECVEPNPETIASGEYPIARPLYIYVNNMMLAEEPALDAFVDHYMGYGLDEAAANAGYVTLSDDRLAEVRQTWEAVG